MKSTLMRRLSILLVLAMVLAMLPVGAMAETPTTLYLQPNSNWLQADARFAAYFFGNGTTWVDMTDADADGVYEVAVPEGYPNVIFCRMNPGAAANDWNNKWNQTGDLVIPTDGKNFYAVPAGSWDGSTAAWGSYTAGDEVTEAPAPVYNYDYYVIGTMNSWKLADDAMGMTDTDGDGIYTLTVAMAAGAHEYKINVGDWSKEFGNGSANYTLSLAEACDVTFTLNPTTGEVTATGAGEGDAPALDVKAANVKGNFAGLDFDEASEAGAMTLVDGIYTATFAAVPASAVGAEAYKFKVVVNNSWNTAFPSDDWTFYLTDACDVTITYNPANNEVTLNAEHLTYDAPTEGGDTPVDPVVDTWHVKGDVAGLDWDLTTGTGAMTKNDDGSYSLTIENVAAANKYSVKAVKNSSWDGAAGGMGAGGNFEFSVSAACAVTFTVSAEGALSVTGDNVGEPVATELVIESVIVAGNGDGSNSGSGWLNGIQWNPASSVNQLYLEEGSDSVYSISFYNLAAGTYEFKFAINGSWDISYASGDVVVSGETYTAWASPLGNSSFVIEKDGSNVTLVLDMTGVVYATDNASMYITIEAPAELPSTSAPETLVVGENEFVIGSGDTNLVAGTFTATTTGTLNITFTYMNTYDAYFGGWSEIPASYIPMQFGRSYALMVNGETVWLPASIDVVAGETYEIGVMSYQGNCTELTMVLCDNHNMAYSFADGYHTVGCATCGQSTSVEGTNELKFRAISLALGSDISINYKVTIDSCFDYFYVVFEVGGEETIVSDYTVEASTGRYVFTYEGINPQLMGENICATVYASMNGNMVTATYATYSVLTYCSNQLSKEATTAENRTMISNLLVYGAKVQILKDFETDSLLPDRIDSALAQTPTSFPGTDALVDGQVVSNTELKNDTHDMASASLVLSNKVSVKFGYKLDDATLYTYKVTVNGTDYIYTSDDLTYDETKDRYYLEFSEFYANEFDAAITAVVLQDGVQVSRGLTYTVNTYIKKNANNGDALADVLKALYCYGESAKYI